MNAPAATLEKIERSSREALVEMRRLLGVLRESDGGESLTPQPGIADLDALSAGLHAAGLPVELTIEGPHDDLPPALQLSVYRIVQEALTNALKHAEATRAEVHIRREAGAVTVDVVDDGIGGAGVATEETGHGLVGMRERVALFGGTLEVAPRPEGGFAVHASLRLADAT